MSDPLRYRQSRLRDFAACPRRAVLATNQTAGFVGSAAHLGSAVHAVVAEILRTLVKQDEPQIATEDAIAIAREVLAAGPWVLTAEDDRWLRQMVYKFCEHEWMPSRIRHIEERLEADVLGPDGELRCVTGTPDAVIVDPPRGALIIDWKSGLGVPRTPRELPEGDAPIRGAEYQSDGAYQQLTIYALLIMRRYPRVQVVTLREVSLRWGGPPRESTISREDLEHVEPFVGRLAMQLDRALEGGENHELSQPRPGAHCTTRCPVARSCPVSREQRGLGVLETAEDAEAEAARLTVISALRDQMTKALKARHEATGEFIAAPGGMLGWHVNGEGKRRFEVRPLATHPWDPS